MTSSSRGGQLQSALLPRGNILPLYGKVRERHGYRSAWMHSSRRYCGVLPVCPLTQRPFCPGIWRAFTSASSNAAELAPDHGNSPGRCCTRHRRYPAGETLGNFFGVLLSRSPILEVCLGSACGARLRLRLGSIPSVTVTVAHSSAERGASSSTLFARAAKLWRVRLYTRQSGRRLSWRACAIHRMNGRRCDEIQKADKRLRQAVLPVLARRFARYSVCV